MIEPNQKVGATSRPQVLVVTGMSGAGRSSAAKVLEDLGFSVIDNLPPQLIAQAISHHEVAERRRQLAVVIDSRVGDTLEPLTAAIDELERQGVQTKVLFLEAEDSHLVRRYEENRRPHPVRRGSLAESITAERKLLSEVKGAADVVIDTTDLNIHQLRQRIGELFSSGEEARPMRVTLTSFGYKHGLPRDADLIFDVRFLPNPHWVKELRPLRGTDPPVRDYVLSFPEAKEFLDKVKELLTFLIPRYVVEGKSYLAIGLGCTGGHHRSVALAGELANWLAAESIVASVNHRDINQ
ncbi:MAG TPA: RNase adapter RapZ [Acidimicrobiia bacterium]|nr:RNase adapter RapZ [Acidimicrobiia bacterium]